MSLDRTRAPLACCAAMWLAVVGSAQAGIIFPVAGVTSVGVEEVPVTAVVQPVAITSYPKVVSVVAGGQYLANYPPASDCVTRALALARNCTPFLEAINANCGQLSIFTIKDILALAKTNISADIACYNGVAAFFNGGCLCSNTTIRLIQTFNSDPPIPDFAKQAITALNQAKCPNPVPPAPPSNSSSSAPPCTTTTTTVAVVKPAFVFVGRRLKSWLEGFADPGSMILDT